MTPELQHALNKAKVRERLERSRGGKELTDAECEKLLRSDYQLLHPGVSDWDLAKLRERERKATVGADVLTVVTADLIRANRLLHHLADRVRRLELKLIQRGSGA